VTVPASRCAAAWVGSALLVLAAPRCAPQDVYFYDPELQTVGARPDAGAPGPGAPEPDGDGDAPGQTPPDDAGGPEQPYEPVQPACESEVCERCLETASCAGSTLSLCHPQSGSCVAGCDPSAGDDPGNCALGARCDEARGLCLECVTSEDCAAPTPVCDAANGSCVGCVSNYDCTPQAPVCDTDAHECIGCRVDADCAATFEVCRESVGRCVECESNADCIARPEPGDDDDDDRFCSPGLRCVECLSDDDCSDDPDKPFCTSELECDDERE
jgi:hypothetical protein